MEQREIGIRYKVIPGKVAKTEKPRFYFGLIEEKFGAALEADGKYAIRQPNGNNESEKGLGARL